MKLGLALPPDCTPLRTQGGCALWRVELDAGSAPDASLLSAAEQARAQRFSFERDRRRYIKGRSVLRLLLARRLDSHPAGLQLHEGPQGKPFLADAPHCRFNMSHSASVGLIGMGGSTEIGVDVEACHRAAGLDSMAETILSLAEQRQLLAMAPEQRCAAMLCAWTRKEACVKAIGTGLHIPPNTFTTGFSGNCQIRIADRHTTHVLRLQTLEAGADVVASLAHMT